MIRLNLTNEPAWLDLAPGLRLRLAPCSSAVMMAARADAAVEDLPEDASNETRALVFAKAIGRIAILDWEGVGDIDGDPIEPNAERIGALLDLYPASSASSSTTSPRVWRWNWKKRLRARAEWRFGGGDGYCAACPARCADCPERLNQPLTLEGWQVWDVAQRMSGQLRAIPGRCSAGTYPPAWRWRPRWA